MSDSDSDSDEWGTAELVTPPKVEGKGEAAMPSSTVNDNDDDYWKQEAKPTPTGAPTPSQTKTTQPTEEKTGEPMVIVDITMMDPNIHSKFDKHSVNDSAAASALRKKLENNYHQYAKDSELVSNGTVIPCGSSVWRPAIARLREERPGHYFAPIFPPK